MNLDLAQSFGITRVILVLFSSVFSSEKPKFSIPTVSKANNQQPCSNVWTCKLGFSQLIYEAYWHADLDLQTIPAKFVKKLALLYNYTMKKKSSGLHWTSKTVCIIFSSQKARNWTVFTVSSSRSTISEPRMTQKTPWFFSWYFGYVNLRFSAIWITLFQSRDRRANMELQNVAVFVESHSESHYR